MKCAAADAGRGWAPHLIRLDVILPSIVRPDRVSRHYELQVHVRLWSTDKISAYCGAVTASGPLQPVHVTRAAPARGNG